jgi:hypothetical protein
MCRFLHGVAASSLTSTVVSAKRLNLKLSGTTAEVCLPWSSAVRSGCRIAVALKRLVAGRRGHVASRRSGWRRFRGSLRRVKRGRGRNFGAVIRNVDVDVRMRVAGNRVVAGRRNHFRLRKCRERKRGDDEHGCRRQYPLNWTSHVLSLLVRSHYLCMQAALRLR